MASAWHGTVCEVVDVAVLPGARRRGIGTALLRTVLAWAASRGAGAAVSAPSPDGWRLFESLEFESVPVRADVAFYLPG